MNIFRYFVHTADGIFLREYVRHRWAWPDGQTWQRRRNVRIRLSPSKALGATEGTRDEAAACCKPPVCYGWDWNSRLLISDIWQKAYIETKDEFCIANCAILASLNDDVSVGMLSFDFECASPCDISIYDMQENLVWRGNERSLQINAPELWWCNGQDPPYLYRCLILSPSF